VEGDPVNYRDLTGTNREDPNFCDVYPDDPSCSPFYEPFAGLASPQPTDPAGSESNIITVRKYTTTSVKAVAVQNDLRWLQQAIGQNTDCANWLAGFGSAIDYMLDVPGSGATMMAVGVGAFSTAENAFSGSAGSNVPAGTLITVNTNGAFFDSGPSTAVGYGVPSWITGGSDAAQALILLHELAHNLGAAGFEDDGALPDGSPNINAQTQNNQLVMKNCGGVVNQAGGKN
jgi:hypothetical protein